MRIESDTVSTTPLHVMTHADNRGRADEHGDGQRQQQRQGHRGDDVCPVGAIYSEEHVPDGSPRGARYNAQDPNKGHDHTFFIQHSRDVFAD